MATMVMATATTHEMAIATRWRATKRVMMARAARAMMTATKRAMTMAARAMETATNRAILMDGKGTVNNCKSNDNSNE
jgi:hypothetical protein